LPNEKITLRTATRYFDIDGDSSLSLQNWLQPGTYIAEKINEGWARIQTPIGWKVVNLDRAPLERPQGITETQEVIKLTIETKSYYFPITGEVCHGAGTFSHQDALSFNNGFLQKVCIGTTFQPTAASYGYLKIRCQNKCSVLYDDHIKKKQHA
jgi:hypothetical protein